MSLLNRDNSNTNELKAANGAADAGTTATENENKNKMVPAPADVSQGHRTRICKSARRFERYGLVRDGQDLVRMAAEMAAQVEGKAVEITAEESRGRG